MKKILFSLACFVALASCNQDYLTATPEVSTQRNLYDAKSEYKKEFSKALAKALAKNPELRQFVKTEALKMFDKDYDILYQLVRDEMIGGKTFRDIVLEQYSNKDHLDQLESLFPLLTIMVPTLPENSFSAKSWNPSTEIPKVAIVLTTTNDVPIFDEKGNEEILESQYTPAFPVVVVKDNERVVADNSSSFKKTNSTGIMKGSLHNFKFIDDAFNGELDDNSTNRIVPAIQFDPKMIDAYNIYQNADGWQRDYLYYDITPTNQTGQFKYDFQEFITSFRMNDASGLNVISDQTGDDVMNGVYQSAPSMVGWLNMPRSPWAGGQFEFRINVLINASNGIGSSIVKYFSCSGASLFNTTYELAYPGHSVYKYVWKVKTIVPKDVPLQIPLFNWDLNQYASSIKISIEEVDLTEQESRTDTRSVKFATNFGIDITTGTLKKIGLKFGASLESTQTTTTSYSVTKSSDQLGDVIVNFADNFITGASGSNLITREYSSGYYTISVEPGGVQ